MTEQIPDLAPESLGSDFYFVGRVEEADYTVEQRTTRQGEPFTSRSVIVRFARMGEFDDEGAQRELTSYFNFPAMGKVNPNSPLGQFSLAARDAGTPIASGATSEERRAALKKALESNIYVVHARSEVPRGSDRARLYCYPVKLVGYGDQYDVDAVNEFLAEVNSAVTTDEETSPPKAESTPVETVKWEDEIVIALPLIDGKLRKDAVLILGRHATTHNWPQELMVLAATGKLLRQMEDSGFIETVDGKIVVR